MTYTATYSPDDNKLRLYSSSRLDTDIFARVKDAGFRWAPKQELFVAPMWTPQREDLLLDLCGEIGDEDTSLVDRAEVRADRFDGYSESRSQDAEAAHRAVNDVAKRFEFGQPILIGHHSERKARKDAERIESGMRRAVNMWKTSQYWQQRAAGALQHAKYKELPGVRHRRIKTLEADKRSHERTIADSEKALKLWQSENLTFELATHIANYDHISHCFTLADFPRDPPAKQYEGPMGLWSALDGGVINEQQARDIATPCHTRAIERAGRWVEHYSSRIAYELAMLGEQGGLKADAFNIQPGGRVLIGGEWLVVLRVNKREGRINSVTTTSRYVAVRGIEEVKDYRAATDEEAAKVKAATKLPPMVNFPGEGFIEMTAADWKRKSPDNRVTRIADQTETHGSYRYKISMRRDGSYRSAQVFITDAKRVDAPAAPLVATAPIRFEREREMINTHAEPPKKSNDAEKFELLQAQLKQGIQIVSAPDLFPTPPELAAEMVLLADIEPGDDLLEPQAGTARIIQAILEKHPASKITAVEINSVLAQSLRVRFQTSVKTINSDFLACTSDSTGLFDKILMNPPFSNAADIKHIEHAHLMLRPTPRARLVAICANGPRQSARFSEMIEKFGGSWKVLPEGTFKSSGTGVNVALLTLHADCEALA